MNESFFKILFELDSYQKIYDVLKEEVSGSGEMKTALATGVVDSQKCHFACSLAYQLNRPFVFITASELKARDVFSDISFFFPNQVKYYPVKDIIFYSADVKSADVTRQRFEIISGLMENTGFKAVVLSIEALFDRLTEKHIFENFIVELSLGNAVEIDDLLKKLILMGYEKADIVEGPGQFAHRGGIIDIFATIYQNPIRIELWGDQIDSLRLIDPLTQRSVEKIDNVKIYPMRELVFSNTDIARAVNSIQKEFEQSYKRYLKAGLSEEAQNIKNTTDTAIEALTEFKAFYGADKYSPYFYDSKTILLDYFPSNTLVFFDEPQRIADFARSRFDEIHESFKNRIEKGYMLPRQTDVAVTYTEILRKTKKFNQILLSTMSSSQTTNGFVIDVSANFSVKSTTIIQNRVDMLFDDLNYLIEKNYRVLILAGGKIKAERLTQELLNNGFPAAFYEDESKARFLPGKITLTSGSLLKGFEYPLVNFSVICGGDIFASKKPRRSRTVKKGKHIEGFQDLTPGDYVVHNVHGIGIYRGIEKITTEGVSRDYLKISYSDGGNLFVNTAQMDVLQKYIGGQETKPKLNRLGGQEFAKAKSRVKGALAEIAKELSELYAEREKASGFIYSHDTVWQKEFEEAFPYEETEDQINAIADIKSDMEAGKVMDRLICGDVGYGKTEVAIRAAFKTAMDSKQVAYLVPTTILAQQHYNTFTQRMKDFPLNIELMSRFRTDKQLKSAANRLATGEVDIVIGTHRLLSKDISFKNLGLVIVDEEQRFGVIHKEKLKKLKTNVNVLTLTATPIPRTLHMSLSGIRDMSVLDEPPLERQPVQTYVMEYNPEFVRDAIHRELARGGQVYFLHNRVKNISEAAQRIAQLVPEAVVAYAHGQMSERQLENVMMDFIEGEIDVLVCTTIIETGLDIQNVNTIIIQDADYMGLSQLYQLRGRVGRSNRIAYCYLMYRKDKVLMETSEKRLQTIREFTEFGSGFKIAMRDLSMRGAGNVLGAEQHGQMDAVGYEMYLKLLEEVISEQNGNAVEKDFETQIDITINAFIPSFYIENELQKLDIYRRISYIQSEKDYFDVQEEIEDRFGNLPVSVQNLLDIALLRGAAKKIGIVNISKKGDSLIALFSPDSPLEPSKITDTIVKNNGTLLFVAAANPYLTYKTKKSETNSFIKFARILLEIGQK